MKSIYEFITESLDPLYKKVLMKIKAGKSLAIEGDEDAALPLVKKAISEAGFTPVLILIDKMDAEDMGGYPWKDGKAILPNWVSHVEKAKNAVLIFLGNGKEDESLYNAMMPVVLKHTVCDKELKTLKSIVLISPDLSDMPDPIKSRFGGILKA